MEVLQELSLSLSEESKKAFRKYLQHRSNKKERKDLIIFNKLCSSGKLQTKEIVKELYGKYTRNNASAYYFIRIRLKKQLENFILQQSDDSDYQLQISRLTNLARNLCFHKKYKPAWHYFKAAESVAIKAEEYELLNQVYQNMIEYAWTQPSNTLEEVIQKAHANQTAAQETRSINLALSVVHNRLNSYQNRVEKPDIENIVQEALLKFGVQKIVIQKASQYYKLAMLVKVSLEAKNDYEELYKYMARTIQKIEKAKLFSKYNYQYKINLLNVVCYAAARAGNYQFAEKYIGIIEEENKKYPDTDLLTIRSSMAKLVCFGLTGRIREALDGLDHLKKKYKKLYRNDDHFFITLNCNTASLQFHIGNIAVSRKCLNELLNHSKRILRSYGLKDLFYCHSIECLLAIEAEDLDYANSRVKSIERKYKNFLQQSPNLRMNQFIKLLRNIVVSDSPWTNERIKKEVWQFISCQPLYKPGSEFISFNAWLYSKLEKTSYSENGYNIAIKEKIENGFFKQAGSLIQ